MTLFLCAERKVSVIFINYTKENDGFKSHQLHGDKEPQTRGFVEKSRVCGFFLQVKL